MRIKATVLYNDLELKRIVKAGEELDVTDARGKQLIAARVGKEIPSEAEKPEKPVKKRKKAAENE